MTLEEKYEYYLKSGEKIKIINECEYYKIIDKEFIPIKDGMVMITIPKEALPLGAEGLISDESGSKFYVSGPEMIHFNNSIPKWYLETYRVLLLGMKSIDVIGEYVKQEVLTKISLSKYRELSGSPFHPSIKDCFEKDKYPFQDEIYKYLISAETGACSMAFVTDMFTGRKAGGTNMLRHDDKYLWNDNLAYYVKAYNLRFDKEVEEHFLRKIGVM